MEGKKSMLVLALVCVVVAGVGGQAPAAAPTTTPATPAAPATAPAASSPKSPAPASSPPAATPTAAPVATPPAAAATPVSSPPPAAAVPVSSPPPAAATAPPTPAPVAATTPTASPPAADVPAPAPSKKSKKKSGSPAPSPSLSSPPAPPVGAPGPSAEANAPGPVVADEVSQWSREHEECAEDDGRWNGRTGCYGCCILERSRSISPAVSFERQAELFDLSRVCIHAVEQEGIPCDNSGGDLSPSSTNEPEQQQRRRPLSSSTLRPSLSFLVGDGVSNSSHPPRPSLSFLNSDERLHPQRRRGGAVGRIEGKEGSDFRLEQRRGKCGSDSHARRPTGRNLAADDRIYLGESRERKGAILPQGISVWNNDDGDEDIDDDDGKRADQIRTLADQRVLPTDGV
ncbi:unnamed protein product [Linum tenue]|uniref:Uncharacterized protein n=1 Tax=Linum tenue TaxID=586396 RepID=A0AAV0J9F8_9ROSI|nr:unnamed protein product [Linum tenue]